MSACPSYCLFCILNVAHYYKTLKCCYYMEHPLQIYDEFYTVI